MKNRVRLSYLQNRFVSVTGIFAMLLLCACTGPVRKQNNQDSKDNHPRIVNIVNFIRLCEPRDAAVTEDVLYQTVVNQVTMMKKYNLGGSFLLQYDALLDPRYQQLLKSLPDSSFEVGAWWEIPQPLAEHAGLKWRGRYPWDWHANVGFSVGYTPSEREKLVDTYMKDFKQIFGYYPKSVGCWFIDAHTLHYMYQKYGIVASCNCRDQIGTDGYTLWGGYWSQAYYPSVKNAYMPAQTEANQIPVPVFRMLGSDPVPQYDQRIKKKRQGNVTLEPVYSYSGGDSAWVDWYLKEFVEGECMEFAYIQAGQENSFTWAQMAKGLEYQLPLIAKLRDEKKVKVETLAASGKWFRDHYKTTPATAVTIKEDLPGSDCKTVWFDSRFYRANVLWEHGTFRITDIHLFDENFASDYYTQKETTSNFHLYTLPFIDGYTGSPERITGLYLKAVINGKEMPVEGGDPLVNDSVRGELHITWPLKSMEGTFHVDFDEQHMELSLAGNKAAQWFLEFTTADSVNMPAIKTASDRIDCQFKGMDYVVTLTKGSFSEPGKGVVARFLPDKGFLALDLSQANGKNQGK